jgi:AcrR family transcriptional regulator
MMLVDEKVQASDPDSVITAATAMIARDGVAGLTMRGLADAIGTSTQAIYTRYGGKPGLVEAVALSAGVALGDRLAAVPEALSPGARVVAIAEAYCAYAAANPAVFELLTGVTRGRERQAVLIGALHPLRRAVAAMGGDIAMADAVWAAAHGTVMLHVQQRLSADQSQRALSRLLTGITSPVAVPTPGSPAKLRPISSLVRWIKYG